MSGLPKSSSFFFRSVISGLYSAGNNTASVMGHTYPGPGSTIAPAGVFGYLGALHASQQE